MRMLSIPTVAIAAAQFWDTLCGTAAAYEKHVEQYPTLADLRRAYQEKRS